MSSLGLDEIALALAVGGIGLGVLGAHRRAVTALSLIGATLGLAGSVWLTVQIVRRGGSLSSTLPNWLPGSGAVSVTSTAAFFLTVHLLLLVWFCRQEHLRVDQATGSSRFWIAGPMFVSALVLFHDPFLFAAAFLTANVIVVSMSGAERSTSGVLRVVGSHLFVAAVLVGDAGPIFREQGTHDRSTDVARSWPQILFAASLVVPLLDPLERHGGPAQRMNGLAAPFFLTAAVIVQLGTAPFGGRSAVILAFCVSALAAWNALRAFAASRAVMTNRAMATLLLALGINHWIVSSSELATLALYVAAAGASLLLEMSVEGEFNGRRARWLATAGGGVGLAVVFGGVVSQTLDRALSAGASPSGAAIWVSTALLLTAAVLAAAVLKHTFIDRSELPSLATGARWIDAAAVVCVVALACPVILRPSILFVAPTPHTPLPGLLGTNQLNTPPTPDLSLFALGFFLTILAFGIGALTPHRTTTAESDKGATSWRFARSISMPFAVLEGFVETALVTAFRLFSPRRESAGRRVLSPEVMIFVAAIAGMAALVSLRRGGGLAP